MAFLLSLRTHAAGGGRRGGAAPPIPGTVDAAQSGRGGAHCKCPARAAGGPLARSSADVIDALGWLRVRDITVRADTGFEGCAGISPAGLSKVTLPSHSRDASPHDGGEWESSSLNRVCALEGKTRRSGSLTEPSRKLHNFQVPVQLMRPQARHYCAFEVGIVCRKNRHIRAIA